MPLRRERVWTHGKKGAVYATCSNGHQHWGVAGAAGGLLVTTGAAGPRVLLTLRSAAVHHGDTWSVPGGAIDTGDRDSYAAALREIHEELQIDASDHPVIGWHDFVCGGWTYATVLLRAPRSETPMQLGWETERATWFDVAGVDRLGADQTLHAGFARSWPALRDMVMTADQSP